MSASADPADATAAAAVSDADDANVTKVSGRVTFKSFAQMLEQISKIDDAARATGKNEEKKQLLQRFMNDWRKLGSSLSSASSAGGKVDASFFPVMRLLLPHADRRVYNLKEAKLAKYLIEALVIAPKSDDAVKLLNYRAPNNVKAEGDFASVAFFVLKSRCQENGTLSIQEVNHHLDIISLKNNKEGMRELNASIKHLLVNLSALQLKWLIRIMLKDLKIGMKENSVLDAFHQDAMELFNYTSSLEKVCEQLADPNKRSYEMAISLFAPCKPMLGEKARPNEIEKLMHGQPFYIETKFDGERFQIHKSGDKYMFFSRNGQDYTAAFGADVYSGGSLTPYIHSAFGRDTKTLILDGEMCGFNTNGNIIMSKGSEKEFGNVKAIRAQFDAESEIHPCFCAFDILMHNGQVLTNKPLRERLEILQGSFKEIEGRIMYSLRETASTNQQAVDALNKAIDSRLEGIVIKNPESVYKPSVRSGGGWYKVKPDYMSGLNDDMDLLIVGGYYGTGARSGLLSHFLLAVAYDGDEARLKENSGAKGSTKARANDDELDLGEDEPAASQASSKEEPAAAVFEPKVFYTFCKIGSGYTLKELGELNAKLAKKWVKFDAKNPPKHLKFTYEKPDVWIEPKDSFIVQVKAVEICPSDRYKTGCSLRFPRLESFRDNKAWYECMKLSELTERMDKNEGKLMSGAHYELDDFNFGEDESGEPSVKRKKMTRAAKKLAVDTRFRGIDASLVDKDEKNAIFVDKEFCVAAGDDKHSKADLEALIIRYGGECVQNPGKDTFCVLTSKMLHKLDSYVAKNLYDIVKIDWLLRCVAERQLLPYRRTEMLFTTSKTENYMKVYYDRYGDSYTEDLTVETLRGLFAAMSEHAQPPTPSKSSNTRSLREKIAFLENKYFPDESYKYGLFRLVDAYLDVYGELETDRTRIVNSPLDLTEIKLRAYGGLVNSKISDKTTHCIVNEEDPSRVSELKRINRRRERKFHIVSSKWVKKCIEATRMVEELPYHV